MSSPCSSALASRSPGPSAYSGFPGCYSLCLHKDAVGVADRLRNTRKPGPTPCAACAALLRHSLPPCFSSYFGFAAAILCVYRSMLSVYTRPRKAQTVRPMIEYEMHPQPRAHAMSRMRGTALAKPTPCFSSYFGCATAIPRVQRDAPGRGGYDMSIAYGAADATRTPGFSSYFALLHDEA